MFPFIIFLLIVTPTVLAELSSLRKKLKKANRIRDALDSLPEGEYHSSPVEVNGQTLYVIHHTATANCYVCRLADVLPPIFIIAQGEIHPCDVTVAE